MIKLPRKYRKIIGAAFDKENSDIFITINNVFESIVMIKSYDKQMRYLDNFDNVESLFGSIKIDNEHLVRAGLGGSKNGNWLMFGVMTSIIENKYIQYRLVVYLKSDDSIKEISAFVAGNPYLYEMPHTKGNDTFEDSFKDDYTLLDLLSLQYTFTSGMKNVLVDEIELLLRYISKNV